MSKTAGENGKSCVGLLMLPGLRIVNFVEGALLEYLKFGAQMAHPLLSGGHLDATSGCAK